MKNSNYTLNKKSHKNLSKKSRLISIIITSIVFMSITSVHAKSNPLFTLENLER